MGYSVRDFLVSLVSRWLFNEDHPASKTSCAAWAFVQLLMNAARAKDYVETQFAVHDYTKGVKGAIIQRDG